MSGIRAAIRYAKAILEIADSKGVASEVSADMTLIATTIPFRLASTDRITNELGFKQEYTFQEGIDKTVSWYMENYLNK